MEALGIFTMMILTDGGIYKNEIYFVTTDKALASLFKQLSKKLCGRNALEKRYVRNGYRWTKLTIKKRNLACLLRSLTSNKQHIPEFIMEETDESRLSKYLRTVSSTDGGVCFYHNRRNDGYARIERHIIIGCKNRVIKEQLRQLFLRLGITTREVKEGLRISGKLNLTRFRDKVGFYPGCLVTRKSPNRRGYSKNEVLELMLESYKVATPRNSVS